MNIVDRMLIECKAVRKHHGVSKHLDSSNSAKEKTPGPTSTPVGDPEKKCPLTYCLLKLARVRW